MDMDRRCAGCHRPFAHCQPMRFIGGVMYCLACAADIENAKRCD